MERLGTTRGLGRLMIVRYTPCPVRTPIPALAGATLLPRPILAVSVEGPSGARLRDGLLDTGADETVLDPSVAPAIGIDLNAAIEREIHLVGRGRIRCRYATVRLRITDAVSETYEWDAVVAFAPFPLLRSLLGFAGFLQFFDADFARNRSACFPSSELIVHGPVNLMVSASPLATTGRGWKTRPIRCCYRFRPRRKLSARTQPAC